MLEISDKIMPVVHTIQSEVLGVQWYPLSSQGDKNKYVGRVTDWGKVVTWTE